VRPQKDTTMLTRLLGLTSLTLCLLAGYFAITAQYLDGHTNAPADHALVTGLRVLAGACAIPALVFGGSFLNLRDEANMRAQRAAKAAAVERTGKHGG
jgi:hypothetical protein